MTDDEVFRVLSQLQQDMRVLLDLTFYLMAAVLITGAVVVLTPFLQQRRD